LHPTNQTNTTQPNQNQTTVTNPDVPNIFQQKLTPAAVEAAVKKSAAALRVKQLDLVQLVRYLA